jgi:hypothetical protein
MLSPRRQSSVSARAVTVPSIVFAIGIAAANAQSGPQQRTPAQVGIAHDLIACRMPAIANETRKRFPDAVNHSLYVGRGTDLVLIHPDGSEEVVFAAGPLRACVDPCVTYDGRAVLFALFVDPEDHNYQRDVSRQPSHIWRLDLTTRIATQLTFGNETDWQTTAHAVNPQYAAFDLAPLELPDGRILFLSTRDGNWSATGRYPAPAFWRMNADGSNLERMEGFSQAGCQHPFLLQDGHVVWTHRHDAGRRTSGTGNYPLMIARQDLADFKTFAGVHYPDTAWHFGTQLSNGDIVVCAYYHQNNFGHGALVRFPVDPGHPSGQWFGPVTDQPNPFTYQFYGQNDHFPRLGDALATPWALNPFVPSLSMDESSPLLPDGTRAGKSTMPAALPNGHLLFVWSSGRCNALNRPLPETPHMAIAYAANGVAPQRDDLIVLKHSSAWHYLYPKPVVPWAAIHGAPRPATLAPTANDGSAHAMLPAGSPFATTGTSSLYNRESRWPASYGDPFDVEVTNNYALNTAFRNVGQDSYAFPDSAIWAAQIVVDMARVDTRYERLDSDIRSHNNGDQVWGVLGEVPVRKTGAGGAPVLDPQGNPDTSYEVRIPAQTPFHHRIVDRNGLMLTAEQTWQSARPGERKNNCGGCHAHSYEKPALLFAQTAAGQPGHPVLDMALQTPLVDRDAAGNPTLTTWNRRAWTVEWFRDVKPIVDQKCVSCHTAATPGGGLDLSGPDAWSRLAYEPGAAVQFGHHQASRWVRKHAATQSLLVWKVFGERLDGRTNATRSGDVDYTGTIMPPPGSGVPALTFLEQRTFGLWIDLGCLVDRTPGVATTGDPFDDQMRPTLVVSGIDRRENPSPLPPLRIGVYDLHSGIAGNSLDVRVTPQGGATSPNLAAGIIVQDGSVVTVPLPALAADRRHRLVIRVADQAGNFAHTQIDVLPRGLAYTHDPLVRGTAPSLRAQGGAAGEIALFALSLQGLGAGLCAPGGAPCLDLLEPIAFLGPVFFDAGGTATLPVPLPANLPILEVFTQAVGLGSSELRTSSPRASSLQ